MKLWTDLGVLSVSPVQTNLFLYVVLCGLKYLELRYMVVYTSSCSIIYLFLHVAEILCVHAASQNLAGAVLWVPWSFLFLPIT